MPIADLEPIFDAYERLAAQADELFGTVQERFPGEVACAPGCSDCCHALFDLSLVEAMALNRAFNARYGFGPQRSAILAAAGEADRHATRLKRDYYRLAKQGERDEDIMAKVARERVRCPLLGVDDTCALYDARPITCRIYGVPTAIRGKGHVCGKCGFKGGQSYPTVALDRLQDKLADLSRRAAQTLGSRLKELHTVYVPVSMALLTRYDDDYLGIGPEKPAKDGTS